MRLPHGLLLIICLGPFPRLRSAQCQLPRRTERLTAWLGGAHSSSPGTEDEVGPMLRGEQIPRACSAVAAQGYDARVRGDRVEVTVDVGTGVQTFEVTATRAGRRVEVTTGRTIIEVAEVTRGGAVVRTARFMASRVVALVEHPAERDGEGRRPVAAGGHRSTVRARSSDYEGSLVPLFPAARARPAPSSASSSPAGSMREGDGASASRAQIAPIESEPRKARTTSSF